MIQWILALGLAFQVTPELKQHVEAGLAAKRSGNLEAAIREFERVVDLAPTLAAAHVNLGAVYFDKKDYAHAIVSLRKALELSADLPGAHAMLGAAMLAQGYASESIAHLEKGGDDGLLGVALLESGRVRESLDKLEAALARRPGDADLLYYLSQAHARLSRAAVDLLVAQHPGDARTHELLGEGAAAAGNRDAGIKHFRAALELRQDLRGVHLALGELYLTSGNYDEAERELRAETELAPGSAAAAYRLGVVLLNRGETQAALAQLRRADTLQPGMPETLLELGKATASGGDLAAAAKIFLQVLEQERTSKLAEAAHFQLAQIYRKQGRKAEADGELKEFELLRRR